VSAPGFPRLTLTLIPLTDVRQPAELLARIPKELHALASRAKPWTSYVAFTQAGVAVGTCAYKGEPNPRKEVEIAYMTFPELEARGYGTAMSRSLIEIASTSKAVEHVIAQTLREENASVRICRSLGFRFDGEVVDPEDGIVWRWSKRVA
jgi:ribosomal-protein-alanine N-acetyltransferase